jgi:hypothetical protein
MNTVRPDGRVIDERGRYVGRVGLEGMKRLRAARNRRRAPGLGAYAAPDSFMAKVWEFFHPATVQAEYRAAGGEPPSAEEIRSGAVDAAADQGADVVRGAADAAAAAAHGLATAGRWIIVGIVALGVIVVMIHIPTPKRRRKGAR